VFVLFSWMTALFYLYYEDRFKTRALGAYVLLVISAAVSFLLWYTVAREAHEIQPLVPALQSWWMKIHVPANFVGYGTFAMSAMVAMAYLLKTATTRSLLIGLLGVPAALIGVILAVRFGAGLRGRKHHRPGRLGRQDGRPAGVLRAVRGRAQAADRPPAFAGNAG
jgi:ABC-type transport system involved in cytochrome c biogenesis permease subunit